ncbi:hypothetical protein W03_15230 [Nitrosomonas sp. PY1]|uniref:DUF883 family protein n=1 Tax=Nitrosomonas sp. PY1 TaxID=1803906 RepID=UPI001FC8388E|nr:hypothetical protein [Nitrosomonas sp. PY1]GKS69519.1 hypothetical protein W03_15230 [Nitrosomonas sp. PY1]
MAQEKATPNPSNLKDLKELKTEAELKQDLAILKAQVSELMEDIKRISEKGIEHIGDKIEREFEHYSEKATDKIRDTQQAADDGLEEISARVRKNPVTSVAIAFFVGYIVAKITGSK